MRSVDRVPMLNRLYGLLMLPVWLAIDLYFYLTGQIPGDPPRRQ